MPAVSILPYQPAPFEDEILGSWFARLKLHNTQYLWNSFVTTCSGKNPSFAYNFSVFDYLPSDRAQSSRLVLKKLFEALRISEMDVENRHSTLPYWRSTQGPTHAPFALHRWVGTPTQLHPLFEKLPKFCVDCLASDTQREGEPYRHRAHQLPGVKVCHAHQSLLHTSCPSCEQIAGIHADRLIPALSSYCMSLEHCFLLKSAIFHEFRKISTRFMVSPTLFSRKDTNCWRFHGGSLPERASELNLA
ncbi:TniQ family protein [uncultured Herbaspirillum sp.]|uniref:TniQ family protein n=1 Tax=uncultured Herbaspirillum sp. TaxID=160236 RepID=UPI00345252EA